MTEFAIYCIPCGTERGWPQIANKVMGVCEVCFHRRNCSEVETHLLRNYSSDSLPRRTPTKHLNLR